MHDPILSTQEALNSQELPGFYEASRGEDGKAKRGLGESCRTMGGAVASGNMDAARKPRRLRRGHIRGHIPHQPRACWIEAQYLIPAIAQSRTFSCPT